MSTINERLKRLESMVKPKACETCRDWPISEDPLLDYTACGGEPAPPRKYPAQCPDCGRLGPLVMVFHVVPSRKD